MRMSEGAELFVMIQLALWVTILIAVIYYRINNKSSCTMEVKATVIRVYEKWGRTKTGRIMTYQPVFQIDWKGFKRTIETNVWSSYAVLKVGDEVTLLVDPENPNNFRYKNRGMDPLSIVTVMVILVPLVIAIAWFTK